MYAQQRLTLMQPQKSNKKFFLQHFLKVKRIYKNNLQTVFINMIGTLKERCLHTFIQCPSILKYSVFLSLHTSIANVCATYSIQQKQLDLSSHPSFIIHLPRDSKPSQSTVKVGGDVAGVHRGRRCLSSGSPKSVRQGDHPQLHLVVLLTCTHQGVCEC